MIGCYKEHKQNAIFCSMGIWNLYLNLYLSYCHMSERSLIKVEFWYGLKYTQNLHMPQNDKKNSENDIL